MRLMKTKIPADLGRLHLESLTRSLRVALGIGDELPLSSAPMLVGKRRGLETSLHGNPVHRLARISFRKLG